MKLRPFLFSALLSLAALCFPASLRAQFIGYTSPQTVQTTVANNVACTGTVQIFNTPNLGQTQHQATAIVSSLATQFTMQFWGIDNQNNAIPISEIATAQAGGSFTNGVLQAVGYFPIVQIQVICNPPAIATFSINYSGSSSTPVFDKAGYQLTQYDKFVFRGRSQTGTSGTVGLTSPTFNSAGVLVFSYSAAPSGALGSVNVVCQSQSNAGYLNLTFPLANVATFQTFQVSASSCPFPQITYASPGTPNGTFSLEYIFNPPNLQAESDPCQSSGVAKASAVITATATGTTQIVALSGNLSIYVCGYQGSQAAAGAFQWEYGTGASCGTGTTALTGVETTLSGTPVLDGDAGMTIFKAPAGNALCMLTSVAGAFNGKLTYVQQP